MASKRQSSQNGAQIAAQLPSAPPASAPMPQPQPVQQVHVPAHIYYNRYYGFIFYKVQGVPDGLGDSRTFYLFQMSKCTLFTTIKMMKQNAWYQN